MTSPMVAHYSPESNRPDFFDRDSAGLREGAASSFPSPFPLPYPLLSPSTITYSLPRGTTATAVKAFSFLDWEEKEGRRVPRSPSLQKMESEKCRAFSRRRRSGCRTGACAGGATVWTVRSSRSTTPYIPGAVSAIGSTARDAARAASISTAQREISAEAAETDAGDKRSRRPSPFARMLLQVGRALVNRFVRRGIIDWKVVYGAANANMAIRTTHSVRTRQKRSYAIPGLLPKANQAGHPVEDGRDRLNVGVSWG
jgi:hypothetical protein